MKKQKQKSWGVGSGPVRLGVGGWFVARLGVVGDVGYGDINQE